MRGNKVILSNNLVTDSAILYHIHQLIGDCSLVFNQSSPQKTERWVTWNHPDEGFVKINVDGSAHGMLNRAGFRGILRDHDGAWVARFKGFIGNENILLAELKAILHGIQLAWDMGYCNIICESDSQEAIRLILHDGGPFHRYGAVIHNVRSLLEKDWDVSLVHVLREANFCADFTKKKKKSGLER